MIGSVDKALLVLQRLGEFGMDGRALSRLAADLAVRRSGQGVPTASGHRPAPGNPRHLHASGRPTRWGRRDAIHAATVAIIAHSVTGSGMRDADNTGGPPSGGTLALKFFASSVKSDVFTNAS
jgi:hypothetical protein